ncbi:hypothetical protein AWC38_SpisGene21740 [Stylophora pistillata]|uniref:Integrase zinc-binding domain-containing protein n=1 Tax=Stylophora pistillata TaxID=50429 RepID=A0A2B4RBE9_STYPI|nr:hypothetical protein AWC38_SpisGene21740 [Stylophora pistillata]
MSPLVKTCHSRQYNGSTTLIIEQAHEQTRHAGSTQVLAQLSVQYWIISAREAIKEWGKDCMQCRRRKGSPHELTVNVLNDNQETFETTVVKFTINLNGKVSKQASAYTTERVTGNVEVIDWRRYQSKWKHLENIEFPQVGPRTTVDVLIGVDQADLQYSLKYVKGIATLFDPLGLLTPYTVRAKILLQKMWASGVDWDEPVGENLSQQAIQWFNKMPALYSLKVPRCLRHPITIEEMTMHTFVDSSQEAYGAACYVRHLYKDGTVSSRLVASKSLVAPLQAVSIPRLELMAAVVGLKLAETVGQVLCIDKSKWVFWSDSIGLSVSALAGEDKWWSGPTFLKQDPSEWPENKIETKRVLDVEMRKSHQMKRRTEERAFLSSSSEDRLEPRRYSSWNKHREEVFKEEMWAVKIGRKLPSTSKMQPLKPVLDEDGVLRCDGRPRYAEYLPWETRYPIILPRNHWVTTHIIKQAHEQTRHAGSNQVLAQLSVLYSIISAREAIKEWEKDCMQCRRRKGTPAEQIMAPLPELRTRKSLRALSQTSVDFGGPFITKQGRGKTRQKRYLCLVTCLATGAVHLEVAFNLDTDSFLNVFFRMASLLRLPEDVICDDGTNLVGGNNELKDLGALDKKKVQDATLNYGVNWHFNTPLAPHFSSVHEIMIKAAKNAIYAILNCADITDEELLSAVVGAEG